MDRYEYLTALLDANPNIVRLVLNTSLMPYGSSVYFTATEGAPTVEKEVQVDPNADPASDPPAATETVLVVLPQISERVIVEPGTETDANAGYNDQGELVASFWC